MLFRQAKRVQRRNCPSLPRTPRFGQTHRVGFPGPSLGMGAEIAAGRWSICRCGRRVLYVEGGRMRAARPSRLPLYAFVVFVFFMSALPAEAHLNSTGMGPFYDGLVHFLMSPEDIVPVLALALLAGMRGASYGRRALLTLPVAWLLGGLAGLSTVTAKPHPFVASAWFLLLGGLLAADAKVSLRATTALAALLGIYHGYLNGTGMGQFDTATVALLGLGLAVFVLIAFAAAFVVRLRAHWARIAVRVAGSWIAASGFLMLGWAVRTR